MFTVDGGGSGAEGRGSTGARGGSVAAGTDMSGAPGPSGRGHRAASLGVTGTLGPYRSSAGDNEGPYFPSRELSGNFHCYRYSLSPRRYCYEGPRG